MPGSWAGHDEGGGPVEAPAAPNEKGRPYRERPFVFLAPERRGKRWRRAYCIIAFSQIACVQAPSGAWVMTGSEPPESSVFTVRS